MNNGRPMFGDHSLKLLTVVTILVCACWTFDSTCPSSCSCKWKNGKQTVSCERKNLTQIPDNLETSTQVLHFTGNVLKHLHSELFVHKKLVNLQRIYVSECQIKTISDGTFRGLTNLVELDLSKNELVAVPTGAFHYCPALMRLILTDNPVKVLKKLSFNHLSFLTTLELSRCELYDIEAGAFRELHSLEWLYLDDNRLKTIRASLPQNLKGVELRGNPWICDCHLSDFHAWLQNFNVPAEEPRCFGPKRLQNRPIKSIGQNELACLPDVSPANFYLELAEGKNVSLLCHVHSVPEAAVSWWFRGKILHNNTDPGSGLHVIYYIEDEGDGNQRTELSILHADLDSNGTFVCSAENAAGIAQSNFTVKILLKEEPIVIIVAFPFEYFIVAIVALSALAIVTVTIVLVAIARCRKRARRRKKAKEIVEFYEETLKREPSPEPPQDITRQSPEQENPDLITGVMDSEGYPADYGLPRLHCYRTLPASRMKRQIRRYSSHENDYLNNSDVRYTVDGYPLQCCRSPNVHTGPHLLCARKRCGSAHTIQIDTNTIMARGEIVLTESPDEGYGGEPASVVV